jgi:sulfatase modifying factor 1
MRTWGAVLVATFALACAGASSHGREPAPSHADATDTASESVSRADSTSTSTSTSRSDSEDTPVSDSTSSSGSSPDPDPASPPAADACTAPPDMACVPAGAFPRGSDREPNELPIEAVRVSAFWMDRHEVTNAQYAECVAAGACQPAFPYRAFRAPSQPVVAMDWSDADAYCRFRGKRLPTEAEWERAARGPEATTFPWGEARPRDCSLAQVRDARGPGCGADTTLPVGSLPAGHFGLFDMAGNVDEWVADWYAPCYRGCDGECGDACGGEDPRGPCGGALECEGRRLRVVRGGSWWWPLEHATGTYRRGKPPINRVHHRYGFRCAKTP